jgi:hypothetical protein
MTKKRIQHIFLLTIFVFSSILLNAQTVAHPIDYSKSGLSTTDNCNVLQDVSSAVKIGGYVHLPCAGGVTFDGTNLVLKTLYTFSPTSSNLGTAYAIAFPFKAGYIYSLSAVAKGTDGSGGNVNFPYILFSPFNTNPAPAPTDCGAVGQDKWGTLQQGAVGGLILFRWGNAMY